jgi:autotransporter passenger strand-loop-strand repeat protein
VISGGNLEVASGGTASGVIFSSGGTFQVDSGGHVSGTISGFHLGDEVDLRGLAFNSSSNKLTWKQRTSGANASGTLTIKEGTSSTSITLVGSYTVSNFSATSDGRGGTLITDPPITSGASSPSSSGSDGFGGIPGSGTNVHSGGYEFGGGAEPFGGMMRLDSLLSQFAGVISGFDFGDEIRPHSLGFGANAGAPGDKGGSLTLLGQYSLANFNAASDSHGGIMITDPSSSASVVSVPLVAHHP